MEKGTVADNRLAQVETYSDLKSTPPKFVKKEE
jgi:hypothetical protein